ncbi:MAG: hypothetical protein LKF54_00370 [Bacilli bacterium]|jgi:hypothetical protein|nr:hypothetical protein [Bacilli bacterium]
MLNMLIAFTLLVNFVVIYDFSYRVNYINRTFYLLASGVVENAIDVTNENLELLYFIPLELEASVTSYLIKELYPVTKVFYISFTYLNEQQNGLCFDRCRVVDIHLRVPFSKLFDYQKKLTFSIINQYE